MSHRWNQFYNNMIIMPSVRKNLPLKKSNNNFGFGKKYVITQKPLISYFIGYINNRKCIIKCYIVYNNN